MDEYAGIREHFMDEEKRIDEYMKVKKEIKEKRKLLGAVGLLRYLPYPQQMITMLLGLLVLALLATYFPVAVDFVMTNWMPTGVVSSRTLFLIACGVSLMSTGLLVLVLVFGGPVRTFIRARIFSKDVYELYHKSGKKDYLVPKEEVAGVAELTDDKAVQPDSNSFYSGPNGRRMTSCVPELPVTFNPRKLLENQGLGLDMMMLKVYGIKHEQKQWEKMKSGKEWIAQMLPMVGVILGIVIVIGAIFGPYFWGKMGDFDEGKKWRVQYEACRVDMLNKGMIPSDTPTPTTTTLKDETKVNDAFMGITLTGR